MKKNKKIFLGGAIVVITGLALFFHTPNPSCNMLRDPSGNLSKVCDLWKPSPYQKIFLATHNYFYPSDMCAVDIETGTISCRSFSALLCDQSATTTPCTKILRLKSTSTPQVSQNDPGSSVFSFGPLTNIYTNEDLEFSLKYPENFVKVQVAGWHDIVDNTIKAKFWIDFCDSKCNSIKNSSLEEYYDAYLASNKGVQTREILTITGVKGIRQDLNVFNKTMDECLTTGEEGCMLPRGVRYVFFHPKKGFFVIKLHVPASLEEEIIQSVSY